VGSTSFLDTRRLLWWKFCELSSGGIAAKVDHQQGKVNPGVGASNDDLPPGTQSASPVDSGDPSNWVPAPRR